MVGLYGENWRPAADALRVLCIVGALKVMFHLAGPVAQTTGHLSAEVRRQGIYLAIVIAACLTLVPYGIEAVGGAVALGSLWLYLSMAQLANRIVGCTWAEFFRAQLPGVAIAAMVTLAQLLLIGAAQWGEPLPPPLMLAVLVAVSALAFALGFFYLPQQIVGDMPAWLARHYAHYFPAPVRTWLVRRFPHGVA
jgi:O-antigen/teichoic acid export membrane protein